MIKSIQSNNSYASIFKALMTLTIPIVGGQFLQMTYNFTDMFWVGKLGSGAVAAVGTAGFFTHLAWAFASVVLVGTGVKISHAVGANKLDEAKAYINNGFSAIIILGIATSLFYLLGAEYLIQFFKMKDPVVDQMAINYLMIMGLGIIVTFINFLFTAIFNAYGATNIPFKVNATGLVLNIILDPIFIFVFDWGVEGAAWATLLAQVINLVHFWIRYRRNDAMYTSFGGFDIEKIKEVLRLGFPVAFQRIFFTIIMIGMARIIAQWGPTAIAAQKVGLQLEALTFMTVGGLHQAITTFVGQKYGAKDWDQLLKGYYVGLFIGVLVGAFVTIPFLLIPDRMVGLFLSDPDTIEMGAQYLRIIGLSQVFMCMEMVTGGALNGIGKTKIPAIISVVFTSGRIPTAIILSSMIGLDGVWWSVTISSICKGLVSLAAFYLLLRNRKELKPELVS